MVSITVNDTTTASLFYVGDTTATITVYPAHQILTPIQSPSQKTIKQNLSKNKPWYQQFDKKLHK